MRCQILFFGAAKGLIDPASIPSEWPSGIRVSDIRTKLNGLAPELIPMNYAIAVNQKYTTDDLLIPDGAEIAILPPVSGG